MPSHITLIIPGLFDSLSRQNREMPRYDALETILAKSDQQVSGITSYHDCILKQFDIEFDVAGCIAAVSRFADTNKQDDKVWMVATPVFLNADKDRLILQGQSMLSIKQGEADKLVNDLNDCYKDDGWLFESCHPERWYVSLPELPVSQFSHYIESLGRNIEPFMPKGSDQLHWRSVINEMQMLLHASDVNQQRLEVSDYPINSVWCWGDGKLPKSVKSQWDSIYTNDVFCKGLGMLSETVVNELPIHADKIIENNQMKKNTNESHKLVIMQQNEEDILSLDFEYYIQRINNLEQNWFKPMLDKLKNGDISSLTFLACNGFCYQLKKSHLRRFWKKRKSI